jgi:ADP-ribose pyrophosphatase YjhB (NUDIX family)
VITCNFEDGNPAKLRHVVIDALVLKNNKLLLVKRTGKLLEGNKWALPGGFVERDENLIQALKREVYEETGWEITDITLLTFNDSPDRPKEDRQNVSLVFFCKASRKTGKPDDESDDQQWFGFDELPSKELMAFDHAENITLYQRYLSENLQLPVLTD